MLGYFNRRPEIGGAATTFNANVPQIYVDVDRSRAEALGLSVSDVYAAIGANFGSRYVNDFTLNGRVFQVNLQADSDFRAHSEDILKLHVRNRNGTMVPLRSVVSNNGIGTVCDNPVQSLGFGAGQCGSGSGRQ